MRILHLTDHYPPVLGGIETHVSTLAARQAGRGDDVCVLTTSPASADGRVCDDAGPVRVRRARSLLEGARVDVASFDVVHAHVSVVAPFTAPVAALAARRGAPTVVTVHSLWNGMGPLPEAAAAIGGLRGAPVAWTAVSEVAASQVRLRLPRHTPVRVLPNAVTVAPRPRTPRRDGDRPVHLVSTMRVARRKRPVQLVRMVDALAREVDVPVRLTIIGDGPLRPRVERLVVRRGLGEAVAVTGRVAPDAVLSMLADADLYVAPAVLESFGLAALEARCAGLPVVGHAGSGLVDFVDEGVEGVLCEDDADMVRRLRDLVTDDDLRTRIAEHNRTVPSPLTWAHALREHDLTYEAARRAARARLEPALRPVLGG
ncbi:MAG TPA: glycosyltransferase family 4 protein [Nocardioidaceae bacterium]|nr:glycosyltransferase family 4 protein [Nocardioidaceae bacterium]